MASDKEKFHNLLGALTLLESCDLHYRDFSLFLSVASWSLEISYVFSANARAQGAYVPPMMIQTIDTSTGEVTFGNTVDDDGTITSARSGRALEVPGAPAAFNIAQAKKVMDLGLAHLIANAVPEGDLDEDGVGATEKNMDEHRYEGMLEEELDEDQVAEAESKQENFKRAKQAKRNAMEWNRKKRNRGQAKHGAQNSYEEGRLTVI